MCKHKFVHVNKEILIDWETSITDSGASSLESKSDTQCRINVNTMSKTTFEVQMSCPRITLCVERRVRIPEVQANHLHALGPSHCELCSVPCRPRTQREPVRYHHESRFAQWFLSLLPICTLVPAMWTSPMSASSL